MSMLLRGIKNMAAEKKCANIAGKGVLQCAPTLAPIFSLIVVIAFFVSGLPGIACAQEKPAAVAQGTSLEEERLKILKADIQSQIEELKKLKQELEQQKKGIEGKRQEQLVKVVKMYEAMPAEEAAKAIEKLDDDTAILILTSLKPRTAGKVMAQIEPARAASLSKKALQRIK